ncbi:MAG: UDP-N-acetylmuramoyl-L-alanyl-D-glutamate--2,6-diaminopimelate ligase [Pseudomonadota bacterium]
MGQRAGTKTLAELGLASAGFADVAVTGLSVDSRDVKPGHLFAAMPGTKIHGAEFISYALRMGAAAVLTDRAGAGIASEAIGAANVALVVAEDPRQALAFASALWFARQPETMVAVTGTNGKTSVTSFTRQLWEVLGLPAVNLGTTGVEGEISRPLAHTTPEPITLHRVLAEVADEGVTHGAMEASSHGLVQRRLDGVRLLAAGFTNISQDHLDYHADFEEYFHAKARLFERVLSEDGTAVINIDDPAGRRMVAIAETRGQDVLRVGESDDADLRLTRQQFDPTGQTIRFEWAGQPRQIRMELIGGFQAHNALVAAGLAIATGADPGAVFAALGRLETVRGRMQLAATRANEAAIYVDYAHTPDAIRTALAALRPHVMGRIIIVFGAGGDRDKGKRPLMGEAAAEGADVAFVTDDNPRSEDPAAIRAEILQALPKDTSRVSEVPDRAEAILRGVDALGPGDVLLIAGKGHESGQIIGDDVLPFDDVEQASVSVAALDGAAL